MRVKSHRPNLWVIDDLETPDTISNPKRMRKKVEHIKAGVIATMIDKTDACFMLTTALRG